MPESLEDKEWWKKFCEIFPEDQFREMHEDFLGLDEFSDGPKSEDMLNLWQLWFILQMQYAHVYDEGPYDEELLRRIWMYWNWCGKQAERTETADDDPVTVIHCAFTEHITPERRAMVADLPRWLPREEAEGLAYWFRYHGGEEGYAAVMKAYDDHAETVRDRRHRGERVPKGGENYSPRVTKRKRRGGA
jgi:hypothetical protein